ncbi:MAG: restriction endonuclease [Lachnospiraceae bacterium]|nr:restriction endonuclease [Lachnospiraceae bacterium]
MQIDLCIDKEKSTTEKGRILENLVAQILKVQQYEVIETIRVTGMEVDVYAKHKVNNITLLVECKAWDSPLPADVIWCYVKI